MATYEISGFAEYQVDTSNNNSAFQGTTVQNFTFDDDSDGDTTFEIGDVLGVVSGNNLNYLGNMSVPLVGGGSMELALVQGAASYVDPNVIQVLIVVPLGMSVTDFIFPDPIDYSARETDAFPTCFVAGSQISTPMGTRAVEALCIGDLIETANGAVPVKWIGRQTVMTRFGPAE
uniref:Hint domain-containing protein n=1 Tax=Nioella sediminis TaxID=1912092 RepID=UPI000A4AC3B5